MDKKRTSALLGVGVVVLVIILAVLVFFYLEEGMTGAVVATGQPCADVNDAIVAWWKGEGNAYDSSGNGPRTVNSVSLSFTEGAVGQAFSFARAGSVFTVAHNADLNFDTEPFTIEAWVKNPEDSSGETIIKKWATSEGYIFGTGGAGRRRICFKGNNEQECSTTEFPANTLTHVAVTRSATTVNFYIDGESTGDGTIPTNIGTTTTVLWVGNVFHGLIDELTIHGRALNADEIQQIYTAGDAGKCEIIHEDDCGDTEDNDDDGRADCQDSDCYSERSCRRDECAPGRIVTWTEMGTDTFYGCCQDEQCAYRFSCLDEAAAFSAEADTTNEYLCSGNDIEICTSTIDGTLDFDNTFVCYENSWQECNTAMVIGGKWYCDGSVWQDCDTLTNVLCAEDVTEVYFCTEENEGSVQSNHLCQNEAWVSCDSLAHLLCLEISDAWRSFTCNQDNLYLPLEDIPEEFRNKYYCAKGSYEWVECNEDTLGEGIDNEGDTSDRYNDNYVCNGEEWIPVENCGPCRGERSGFCTGSQIVDATTGLTGQFYYDNPDDLIGCAGEDECFFRDNNYRYDRRAGDFICGSRNQLLDCAGSSSVFPSDENTFLCRNGRWDECSASLAGMQAGSFVCSYNAEETKWQWFSEFACSPTQRYQIKDSRTFICDGANWLDCPDLEINNPFTEPEAEVSCRQSIVSVEELICNNHEDDDNDGFFDCRDPDCSDPLTFTLGEEDFYEVTLTDEDCFRANILKETEEAYSHLSVCDTGTEVFSNRVTLCYDDGQLSLDATKLLQRRFAPPFIDDNNLAFVYEESNPKAVRIMLTYDLAQSVELPLQSGNFAAGQHLMLHLEGEYYQLGLQAGAEFAEENMLLTHLSTNRTFPAEYYAGTNRYVFNVFADRVISFAVDTLNRLYRLEVISIEEASLSYPFPASLEESYEVSITLDAPRRITGLGRVSICREDNKADPYQVLLCRDDQLELTLLRGELTKRTFGGRSYLFLYELVNGVKQVSLFYYQPCRRASLDYNSFINNLIAGRKLACEEENAFYLIAHPERLLFSLTAITITGGSGGTYAAAGNEVEVSFLVPGKRIYLARDGTFFRLRSEPEIVEERATLPGGAYSAAIPNAGVLLVGGTELQLCNQALYRDTTAADVCFSAQNVVVSPAAKITIDGEDYVLEVNGQKGDNKQVTIRRVLKFQGVFSTYVLSISDWMHLTERIIAGDFPLIALKDSLYRPKAATSLLNDFSLEKYPSGRAYALREKEELSPITAKGYFVLDEGVILAEQSLAGAAEGRKVTAKFSTQPYQFLPDGGTALEISGGKGAGEYLAAKLNGKMYHLTLVELSGHLASLRMDTGEQLLFAKDFAQGNKKKFYLDGVLVEMEIAELNEEKAVIKLRRSFA